MQLAIPRLVIAGPASGVGKTTVTIAIARALRARGLNVALFKCGPDFLDPTYHARANARPSHTLDGWMMGSEAVLSTFERETRACDIALIEGVMGLFDGASPTDEAGSTAEIAKWLLAPVLLVVDASGMARSIAALVHGFASFDLGLKLGGVLANRIGSRGHLELLQKALKEPPILGGFPKDPGHAFPERHLGLLSADERTLPDELLDHWGARAEEWISLERVLALANSAPTLDVPSAAHVSVSAAPRCRIGIAQDAAFHFYYPDNLARLEASGAKLVPFSPLVDRALPEVDAVYFGGGYPEVHAARLAQNLPFIADLRQRANAGLPIYAECGGLMYLTRAIRTLDGVSHAMVGLIDAEAHMHDRLQALGYVEVETTARTILGDPGLRFRGHQFRYSELVAGPPETQALAYSIRKRRGNQSFKEGYVAANLLASYVHAHWASNGKIPEGLVSSAEVFRRAQTKNHAGGSP